MCPAPGRLVFLQTLAAASVSVHGAATLHHDCSNLGGWPYLCSPEAAPSLLTFRRWGGGVGSWGWASFGDEAKPVLPGMLGPSYLAAPSEDWHPALSRGFPFSARPSSPPTARLLRWAQAQREI